MNSATPVLLALLLVVSLPAMSVGAVEFDAEREPSTAATIDAAPQQEAQQNATLTQANNTTNRLPLDGEVRSEHVEYGNDLGTTLASADDELRVEYGQYVLVDSEFNNASAAERADLVRTAYDQLRERTEALESREREAVRAHADGDRSTTGLLQTLSRNYHEAGVISAALDDLSDRANRIPGYSLSVRDEQTELDMHRTVIQSRLETTERSPGSDELIAVQTSEDGYTLAMVNRNYVRETTRFDNRDTESSNQFSDITDAHDAAKELYPWVFETRDSSEAIESRTVQLYQIRASHDQGRLISYLDGGTGDVHREIQRLSPASLPVSETHHWTDNGLELSINETPANGPVTVTVTDADTGDPKSATIAIDGTEVGETDDDGTLWILPSDGEYDVTAETPTERIEVTPSDDRSESESDR